MALVICQMLTRTSTDPYDLIRETSLQVNNRSICHAKCSKTAYIRYVYIIIPNQGLANFFCEGPDSKYFQLCGLYSLSGSYSIQPL